MCVSLELEFREMTVAFFVCSGVRNNYKEEGGERMCGVTEMPLLGFKMTDESIGSMGVLGVCNG